MIDFEKLPSLEVTFLANEKLLHYNQIKWGYWGINVDNWQDFVMKTMIEIDENEAAVAIELYKTGYLYGMTMTNATRGSKSWFLREVAKMWGWPSVAFCVKQFLNGQSCRNCVKTKIGLVVPNGSEKLFDWCGLREKREKITNECYDKRVAKKFFEAELQELMKISAALKQRKL